VPGFPEKEADIAALAEQLWRGLWSNRSICPNPPVHPILLRFKTIIYRHRRENLITKQAATEAATTTKDEILEDLVEAMKADIRYAENIVDFDDDKLKLISWAGRKERTQLAPPGQARLLEAPKQGEGWVFLDSSDGGAPAAYKVMRRELPVGPREEVATAVINEATLVEQLLGKELKYHIIAVNKAVGLKLLSHFA
jgi:hypothetical protein